MPFVPIEKKNRGYLYMILNSVEYQQYMVQCSSSSTGSRKRMPPELCGVFKLPYPMQNDDPIIAFYNELMELLVKAEKAAIALKHMVNEYQEYIVPLMANGDITINEDN